MFVCKSQEVMRKGGIYMFLSTFDTWADKILDACTQILVPLLIIGAAVGMIYAVVVGIKMMKADDKSARDEAKAKLINIAISIVAIAVLIGLFYALASWLNDDTNSKDLAGDLGGLYGGSTSTVNPLMNTVNLVKQCVSMVIFKC